MHVGRLAARRWHLQPQWAALAAILVAGPGLAEEPSPSLEKIRESKIRRFPVPDTIDLELIAESYKTLHRVLFPEPLWPDAETFLDVPILLITQDNEYVIDHPGPPASHFLVETDALFGMKMYGFETARDCHVATARPVFGAPTIVKGSVGCTGESSTDWMFDYIRQAFRAYLYRHSELLKISRLNLPFPDPNEKWKTSFPFPFDDLEVVEAVRALGRHLHVAFWLKDETQRRDALEAYFPARRRVDELLEARSEQYSAADYFRYFTWAEGVPLYAAYEGFQFLALGAQTPPPIMRAFEDFIPFRVYVKRNLERQFTEFARSRTEPLTPEDLALIGALSAGVVAKHTSDWKTYVIQRDVWLEDLMARARLDAP